MLTPLDTAHEFMTESPDQDAARLRFYERLASVELFLLLSSEPTADKIAPQVFPVEGAEYMLVFDSEARLSEFSGQTAAFVAMSGRAIVEMVMAGGRKYGLGINLGVAPSSFLLDHDGVIWLSGMLGNSASAVQLRPQSFTAPFDTGAEFLAALSTKLAGASGMAQSAILVGVNYEGGAIGNLLAFVDAVEAAEAALRQAIGEVVSFSAGEGAFDIGFFTGSDKRVAQIKAVGLEFEIPVPIEIAETGRLVGPGMDPNSPPKLR
ncbi:MAG: hypothetical protein ACI9ZD_000574 [Paracoccaceae bacterium]|jgi:hypothetical protein